MSQIDDSTIVPDARIARIVYINQSINLVLLSLT